PVTVPVGAASSCTATVTDTTPGVARSEARRVGKESRNTGTLSATSSTLSGSSTNPITGFVSSSCSVTYTPTVVGLHTITATYAGDGSHLGSSGAADVVPS